MNPQTPSQPQPSGEHPAVPTPEHAPVNPETQTRAPEVPVPAPANANAAQTGGQQLTAGDVAAAIAQMPAATPAAPTASTPPADAADQDVIEPEWVDQAEAIIAKTAGDPHAEEEAVESLQVDYLNKRYGHQVKKPTDEAK